ncbi:uncharacterized protein LOC114525963 [Dendronephthya gigantea]|uniref:uncharacterized protein LOC114525963 n=1 Tax=Dendronephthya gigantea TaxID=151771 RepID=UPI00106C3EB2|nr:uncharacterized protein LOC114525963 [Dendronephthya gigantea]
MFNLKRFTHRGKRRQIASEFSSKIVEIIRSQHFHVEELTVSKHRVNLSQACVLLWRDWFTGDVDGLWTNSSRLAAAYACIFLELIALGKISCKRHDVCGKTAIKVKILDRDITNSYLDQTVFCHMLRLDKTEQEMTLDEYLLAAMKWRCCRRRNCASLTLESLDDLEILRRDGECWGFNRLYKTVDLEPYALLEKEIRSIALKSKQPDCYMRILLTLVSIADSNTPKRNQLLKRFFTKNEYLGAIERIQTLANGWNFEAKT